MAHNDTKPLPSFITGTLDVSSLIHELDKLEENFLQLKLRQSGSEVSMPKSSTMLNKTAEIYNLNLLHEADRKNLANYLRLTKDKAPIIHISFNADPTSEFLDKLILWLRSEIHPNLLVTVGLQPTIGAGCIVRTLNRYFDFSLRQDFINKRPILLEKLIPPSLSNNKNQQIPAEQT